MHLLFYDGECGLCDLTVDWVYRRDRTGQFLFAPLQGGTAKRWLGAHHSPDSLVLIEDFEGLCPTLYREGKGALRIAWLLGFPWSFIGALHVLPAWCTRWLYRGIARHRHRFFRTIACITPYSRDKTRFIN